MKFLARSRFGPSVFGCQAPDSGNAEILAHFGTPEQKEKYLQPLLDGKIASCYSMTEPQAGAGSSRIYLRSNPATATNTSSMVKSGLPHTRAFSEFLLVMVVTNPDVPIHSGASIILVEKDTPGMEIMRNSAVGALCRTG